MLFDKKFRGSRVLQELRKLVLRGPVSTVPVPPESAGKTLCKVQQLRETARYRTHRYACRGCELQPQCGAQRAGISCISDTIASALAVLGTPRGRWAMALRKCWVETVNADLKNNRSLSRAHYRGNRAVTIQALLAACAHNIYQLVTSRFRKQEGAAVALRSNREQEQVVMAA